MSDGDRIAKLMARAGAGSRREVERMIAEGRVALNGKVLTSPALNLTSLRGITLDGNALEKKANTALWLFHKPAGCLTTAHDPKGRKTVYDLLPPGLPRLLTVGRLDYNTEGLLIFTNDGDLLHRITHPRYRCRKEYFVVLSRAPSERILDTLRRGVYLPDVGKDTSPAQITRLRRRKDGSASLHIVIHEGMKRQIRRMFSGQGLEVTYLKRISIGKLNLDDLAPGKYRTLRDRDLALLLKSDEEDEKTRPPHPKGRGGRAGTRGGSGRSPGKKTGPGKGRR